MRLKEGEGTNRLLLHQKNMYEKLAIGMVQTGSKSRKI
jgi:hypothetical protein